MQSSPSLLTTTLILYASAVTILTILVGFVYRRIWMRLRRDGVTPTGFGALLAPVMLGAALVSGASNELIISLVTVLLVTALYWIDDLVHLSARVRIIVSLIAGLSIGLAYLLDHGLGWPLLWSAVLAAGIVSVVLTNMVNFYDGADLNLASFVALTAAMILFFTPLDRDWVPVAVGTLAFVLPFALMNSRPRTIYLGDSGSFAFAGMLTAMVTAFFQDISKIAPEAAIPAALPALDVAYVFVVRIIEKHDMLTRNYLHLYQRLNRRHSGFGYLLPQFANVALCLAAAMLLQNLGLGRILSVTTAMIVVTLPFYFVCRRIFLAGPAEGPLYESIR
jgi:UDP-N-acetylmuramyl pentapeptide phosphotransferase/UDP-N-acetylglucosamine-1-phosphate transferase